jgi:hypothetical protein
MSTTSVSGSAASRKSTQTLRRLCAGRVQPNWASLRGSRGVQQMHALTIIHGVGAKCMHVPTHAHTLMGGRIDGR